METLERVLCVEDEADIREIAQLALEAVGGFTVMMCASGEEALRDAPDFDPQLILLDVMMPDMSGLETLERLQNEPTLADVPVVFLTAKTQQSEIDEYKARGARNVIVKPFDPMRLADQAREIWERRADE